MNPIIAQGFADLRAKIVAIDARPGTGEPDEACMTCGGPARSFIGPRSKRRGIIGRNCNCPVYWLEETRQPSPVTR